MKKFTKVVAILLAMCILFITGCGSKEAATTKAVDNNFQKTGYPIVKDKVTLKILCRTSSSSPKDLNTIPLVQRWEKEMNVHIDWITPGSKGFDDKKSLMLASGDLPDLIMGGVTEAELSKYGADGTFIQMEKLINDYAPNLTAAFTKHPDFKAFGTAPDGHMYGVPKAAMGPWSKVGGIVAINKDWLKKLNLQMPTTTDELYTVLKAFKDNDPNGNGKKDEVPFAFAGKVKDNFEQIFDSFGITLASDFVGVKNGKVFMTATKDDYKEGIKYLNKLCKEKLIEKEGFVLTGDQLIAKCNQTPFIVGAAPLWDIGDTFTTKEGLDSYDFLPAVKGPNDQKPLVPVDPDYGYVRGAGVITKACKNPEVAMRWIDHFYTEKNSLESSEGEIGKRLVDQGNGTYVLAPPPAGQTNNQFRYTSCLGASGIWGVFEDVQDKLKIPSTDPKVKFMNVGLLPYADKESMPSQLFYTTEEASVAGKLSTDIVDFIERKSSEWMMNGKVDAEWESYKSELDKMGLKKFLDIRQAALDRRKSGK